METVEKIATRDAYGKTLVELGRENENVVVLDADLSLSTRTNKFAKVFQKRFFDMGLMEQNMMATAAGLATCGKIPFVSTYAVFASERAFNQLRQSIVYPKLNVKIVATHGGVTVGPDGASHQCVTDIAIMRALPNMVVIVPADAIETEMAIRACVKYMGPVYVRLGRPPVPLIFGEGYQYAGKPLTFKIGKAVTLRGGKDATIMATGIMVSKALNAANLLAKEGIDTQVIDIHTIKPIDQESIIRAAKETGRVVTVEEHNIFGGLGSAVAEVLVENNPAPVIRLGVKEEFGESGSPEELLVKYGLTESDIMRAVKEIIQRKAYKLFSENEE